jgi:hypothetical protein
MTDEPRDFTKPDKRNYHFSTPGMALEMLAGMGNVVMSENVARQIAAALGCAQCVRVIKYIDRRSEFHGFVINHVAAKEGDYAYGVDPMEFGDSLVRFYRVPHQTYSGQATQLREYAQVLRWHFEREAAARKAGAK